MTAPSLLLYIDRNLFAKKVKDSQPAEHKDPGWKLFGKVPPREGPIKDPKKIQKEYETKSGRAGPGDPTSPRQGVRKNLDFEPLSTTALILEDRPANLPAKPADEAQKHRQQYEEMVAQAKKRGQLSRLHTDRIISSFVVYCFFFCISMSLYPTFSFP
ncbi:hypothetical protein XENORESO_012867 [Xenotaenia resolanae]|uniref:Uncharacterized protein n=1 Tax=Xenotaenia resolanae TaxID=208358 RepID=A0ABV0WZM9_9TELE